MTRPRAVALAFVVSSVALLASAAAAEADRVLRVHDGRARWIHQELSPVHATSAASTSARAAASNGLVVERASNGVRFAIRARACLGRSRPRAASAMRCRPARHSLSSEA